MTTNDPENEGFKSWERALADGKLSPEQIATLQDMVDNKLADTLQRAAKMLDWQDTVIMPDEHMYGF